MKCLVCIEKALYVEEGTRKPFCKEGCQKVYHTPPPIDRSIFDEGAVFVPDIFNIIVNRARDDVDFGWFGLADALNETDNNQRLETMLRIIFARPDNLWTRLWKVACLNGMDRLVDYMIRYRLPSQNLLNRSLVWVTEGTGDVNVAARLLITGVDPTVNESRILRLACQHGHTELVRLLLADGRVDPTVEGSEALRHASENGHADIVKLLLQDGRADPALYESEALNNSSVRNKVEVVKLLLQDGRSDSSTRNYVVLQSMARYGHIDVVRKLLEDKRINSKQSDVLIEAARGNHFDIVKLLLEDGRFDPSTKNNSLLKLVATQGEIELVKYLFLDKRVRNAKTPEEILRFVSSKGHYDTLKILLQEIQFDAKQVKDAIDGAVWYGKIDSLNLLLQNKQAHKFDFEQGVYTAIMNRHLNVLDLLLTYFDEDGLRSLKDRYYSRNREDIVEIIDKHITKLQRKEAGEETPIKRLKDPIF